VALLQAFDTPYLVVGGGYNLLVRDGGIRGCVISLAAIDTLKVLPGGCLEVGAGVTNRRLCTAAAECSLSGVEFLVGIPGTFGGALAMNAGAHGGQIMQRVQSLTTTSSGVMVAQRGEELCFGYRFLKLNPGEIVLLATLSLEPFERQAIEERMAGFLSVRGGSQRVLLPSAGSFFKNPQGGEAWRLIDQAGLRGVTLGGAQVSAVHANFFVNRGGATAADFLALAALVKERVLVKSGVCLEEEVRVVGVDLPVTPPSGG
jgi:UDP-N-acetylmuramate dehydrogenase